MKLIATAITAISLLSAGCEDPSANKAKATVNEPATERPAHFSDTSAAPETKGEALKIDPGNSKIEYTGSKVTGKHDGGFNQFSGMIDLVNSKPTDSGVQVEIDASSVFSDDEKLTDHLKSKDFFDVTKFPKAAFTSTKIEPDAQRGADGYTITGDLTLHGVTKSVSFPATIKVSDESVEVDSEFTINRKDFGIAYAGTADDLIRDGVVIRLNLNTPRTK